jgi:hypothetical protein
MCVWMYEIIYRWEEGFEITQFQVHLIKVYRMLIRFMNVSFVIWNKGTSTFCVSVSCVFYDYCIILVSLCGYVKCSILYFWCYSWEISLNFGLQVHSIICRTRKEYKGNQGKLITCHTSNWILTECFDNNFLLLRACTWTFLLLLLWNIK